MKTQNLSKLGLVFVLALTCFTVSLLFMCGDPQAQAAQAAQVVAKPDPHKKFRHNIKCSYMIIGFHEDENGVKTPVGTGSAIGISEHVLLTARHCADAPNVTRFEVGIYDNDTKFCYSSKAVIFKISRTEDLALLYVPDGIPNWLDETSFVEPQMEIGDSVYLIGASVGFLPIDIRNGKLICRNSPSNPGYWVASVTASAGISGCGIYSEDTDDLIGVVVVKYGAFPEATWSAGFINMEKVLFFIKDSK